MAQSSGDLQNKNKRLGRGLGSLLSGHQLNSTVEERQAPAKTSETKVEIGLEFKAEPRSEVAKEARVWQIAIDKLSPGEYQPRSAFDKEKLQELATSIKENGIIQPIVARELLSGKYEIIAGERRWRSAQLAGLHEVPVLLKKIENQSALEMALIENIQRESLNAVEEAEAYRRLAEEFSLTQQQISEKVGKDRATVANALRLLSLSKKILDLISQNLLSAGHAKVLLGLQDEKRQLELAQKVMKEHLSVRKLEKLVSEDRQPKAPAAAAAPGTSQQIATVVEELQKALGTKVSLDYALGKGRLTIAFYSDNELNTLIEKLKG